MAFDTTTALITPIIDNKVDYASLDKILDIQLQNNVQQLVTLGSTAETALLSPLEKWKVLSHIHKYTLGKCRLIVGISGTSTANALHDAQKAFEHGAYALLAVTPYYTGYTDSGLLQHYQSIHNNVPLPTIIYNVPSRTGKCITAMQVANLYRQGCIVGIKECTDSTRLAKQIFTQCKGIEIYCGNDNLISQYAKVKYKGAISVLSNIAPTLIKQSATSKKHNEILTTICGAMGHYPNPVSIKYMAYRLGLISSPDVRLPLTIPEDTTTLDNVINRYKDYLL